MHIVIRDYHATAPGVVAAAVERQESLKAAMRAIDGLVAYYIVDKGNGDLATVSVVQDQASAEESIRVAAAWVRENMAQWASNPPTIVQGDVVVSIP